MWLPCPHGLHCSQRAPLFNAPVVHRSESGIRRRTQLLFHPDVVHSLNTIWAAADTDGSHFIEKDECAAQPLSKLRATSCLPVTFFHHSGQHVAYMRRMSTGIDTRHCTRCVLWPHRRLHLVFDFRTDIW